ncbi:MAG: hypothetical protein H0V82_02810 [Candidatus Protochlamydia sp.]|nr:hypothetical protein [Candidatus Protochlamydia sp.]
MNSIAILPKQNTEYRIGETIGYGIASACGLGGGIFLGTQMHTSNRNDLIGIGIGGMVGLFAVGCFNLIKICFCKEQAAESEITNITIQSESEPLLNYAAIGKEVSKLAQLILKTPNIPLDSEFKIVKTLSMMHENLQNDMKNERVIKEPDEIYAGVQEIDLLLSSDALLLKDQKSLPELIEQIKKKITTQQSKHEDLLKKMNSFQSEKETFFIEICQNIHQIDFLLSSEAIKQPSCQEDLLNTLGKIEKKIKIRQSETEDLQQQLNDILKRNDEVFSSEDTSTNESPDFLLTCYQVQISHTKNQLELIDSLLKKLNSDGQEELLKELKGIVSDLTKEDSQSGSYPGSMNTTPSKGRGSRIQSITNSPSTSKIKLDFSK